MQDMVLFGILQTATTSMHAYASRRLQARSLQQYAHDKKPALLGSQTLTNKEAGIQILWHCMSYGPCVVIKNAHR